MRLYCLVEVLLLLLHIFLVGCATAAAGACAAYNISTEAERGTGYSFFLLLLCRLHCDASDVYCCCFSWLLLFLSFTLRCFGRLLLQLSLADSIFVLRTAILRLWLLTALLLRRDACRKNT